MIILVTVERQEDCFKYSFSMSPQQFKKLIIEAYLAGAESMTCGCLPMQTKADAREWFEDNHQLFQETTTTKKKGEQ